ncbi:hypothetical protein [Modestobacter marinus]|uniref:hypothetical protein n=1 Tax=Modestobacter marinus TaxID=477641 RepID=UPI001C94EF1F|nr:hypothetical protein [Modestobacter marinus]
MSGPAGERFERALHSLPPPELRGPEMLPTRLARAAVAALPVDGAGLSIHAIDGMRTPIGASDRRAADAERLQFTHGAGPCIRAHDDGEMIRFDEGDIARNWPTLHESLVEETHFRAVLSVPLLPPLGPLVVLDLYVREPDRLATVDRREVEDVTVGVTRAMVSATIGGPDGARRWWEGPDALRRARVWQATGLINVALRVDTADALAMLKAHAFATGRVVDDVGDDLVEGRLSLETLRNAGEGRRA